MGQAARSQSDNPAGGVDLKRNTFIHGIEEWVDIPGRMTDEHEMLYTVLPDGTKISVPSRRHCGLSWSEHFWKVDEVLVQAGAMHKGSFGDAVASVCDAERTTEVLTEMLKENRIFSRTMSRWQM